MSSAVIATPPHSAQQKRCDLNQWNLPPLIVSWFRKKGITSLFGWQVDCLCKNDVLFGGNLVYSAPTSAGKTLVADFLLLKKVLECRKKALVIEPFVALTREKADNLKSMLYTTKARVGAFGGNYYTPGGLAAVHVAVCTIEKANNFINKLIAENKLGELGIIVVDEIHYVGDERRGHQLELLLTKVLYYNNQREKENRIQIVGLSATIPNLKSLASWLKASLYVTDYRPVPLVEKIKISNKLYDVQELVRNPLCEPSRVINPGNIVLQKDFDGIFHLCIDSIVNDHSTLIFCETKRECEVLASSLAEQIKFAGGKMQSSDVRHAEVAKKLRDKISKPLIMDIMEKLRRCPAGADKELAKSLGFGAAFHHAGLTTEEREIVEVGFRSGAIKTLFATSTLSSGVNLPARRVIIRSPMMIYSSSSAYSKEMLNPTTYRQMIGRAGRQGLDTNGESILVCNQENHQVGLKLIRTALGEISSSLGARLITGSDEETSGLKKAVLEVIANGTATTRVKLNQYLHSTLWLSLASSKEEQEFLLAVTRTLRFLVTNKFIEELKPGHFRSTRLGNAVLASGLSPDDSLELLNDLTKARQGFCLLNNLHIIYQVTPNDIARTVDLKDWHRYAEIWWGLDEVSKSVGERVGVNEETIIRRCQGRSASMNDELERIYRRFLIALVINDLISEMPMPKICTKYCVTKSMVQQAQRAVGQFAGIMSIFCEQLGYDNISALVTPLELRINFSCQRDLLDLIKLNITRPIARTLFNAGYSSVISVAKADKLDIEFIIRQTKPFKKDASFHESFDQSPSLWVPELAKTMTTLDYASHIVDTARSFVEIEFDIDIPFPTSTKRKDIEVDSADSMDTAISTETKDTNEASPLKRTRLSTRLSNARDEEDEGNATNSKRSLWALPSDKTEAISLKADVETSRNSDSGILEPQAADDKSSKAPGAIDQVVASTSDSPSMAPRRRSISTPHFEVSYLRDDEHVVNEFLNRWVTCSSVSINFKLDEQISEPIGMKVKRRRAVPKTGSQRRAPDTSQSPRSPDLASDDSQNAGLELRLDISERRQLLTRLYVCFDDEATVHIVGKKRSMEQIRDQLPQYLRDSYSSVRACTETQRRQDFVPTNLFVQKAADTYKVLHAALGLDQGLLRRHFNWLAFDVAWWMVNDCPYRGLNNRNSSLSLVAKTRWAAKYHHFLHTSVQNKSKRGQSRSNEEFLRLRDIVKAGKTAILKPLINEVVEELRARNQTAAYFQAEVPSRLLIAQLTVHGIGVDTKVMGDELNLYEELCQQLTEIAQKYFAKSNISLTNVRHVARVLYEELDLKKHLVEHQTNANIAKDPTCGEVLAILAQYHPFPRLVQDFRKIHKAQEALQAVNTHSRFDSDLNMNRVAAECDFWQLTGRVAMSNPDLMLINRNFTVVIPAHGRRDEELVECNPRRCFVPASGWVFVAADYSQLELRLLAHFSNDTNLLEVLNRGPSSSESYDVFRALAGKIYRKPVEEITDNNRQHAKQICYGIIYGMGNKSLAIKLGVSNQEAEQFREDFFGAFPKIQEFIDDLLEQCQRLGYVESLLGRRRPVDGLESEDSSERGRARRVTINTRIQSSASDLIKLAMERVNNKILEAFSERARLVLEMHDELIYEVHPVLVSRFAKTLKFTMEGLAASEGLSVKLLANLKQGPNWSEMKSYEVKDGAIANVSGKRIDFSK